MPESAFDESGYTGGEVKSTVETDEVISTSVLDPSGAEYELDQLPVS